MKKNYLIGILLTITLIVGFFVGRCTRQTKGVIRYVKGETIHDTIVIPHPIYVEIPSNPKYIYEYDTLIIDNIEYISEKVDTTAIIQDYILMRTYEFNVFNSDTLGKFDVKQQIGYNKLLSFDYTFTPISKQITQYREPLFTPFVTAGYSTNQTVLLGGGFYYKNIGLEYNMNVSTDRRFRLSDFENQNFIDILNDNRNYHTFKLNYKF